MLRENERKIKDTEPKCRVCGIKLNNENWYESVRKGNSKICKQCQREYHKQYYLEHLEEEKQRQKQYNSKHKRKRNQYLKQYRIEHYEELRQYHKQLREKYKKLVFEHYGAFCVCCGLNDSRFLSIDHVNGGGRKHRKEIGRHIYVWLVKNKFPVGFQVLCHNCNQAKGIYGECPHQTDLKMPFNLKSLNI